MGRRPIGKSAMTGAERVRRFRERHGVTKPVTKLVVMEPGEAEALRANLDALRRENMDLRTQNAALARENGLLKYAALHGSRPKHVKPKAEAADPVSEEVESLRRQLTRWTGFVSGGVTK